MQLASWQRATVVKIETIAIYERDTCLPVRSVQMAINRLYRCSNSGAVALFIRSAAKP